MVKRKEVQDREVASKTVEKGLLIVHTGPGKGKSTAAFGLMLRALGRGLPGRRRPVHQGRLGDRRAPRPRRFADQVEWHTMGEGFTWETQDRARDVAAAERAWEQGPGADGPRGHPPPDPRRTQHRPALRLPAARRSRRDAAAATAGPPRRRHRTQRQARADRGRRPRHRDDAREAPFLRRREGPGRHRVLMPTAR